MRHSSVTLAAALAIGLICHAPLFAQKKPPAGSDEPAASGKKAPPSEPLKFEPSKELTDQFVAACEADDSPKVLLMIGQATAPTRHGGDVGGGATTAPAAVGDDLLQVDSSGITEMLASALGKYLQDGFGDFVDPSAIAVRDRQEILNKVGRDDREGIDALKQKLNADLVIYIRFQPLAPADRPAHGERYRCVAELKHLRRGTKRAVASFDWDGPIDARNAKRYGGALAEEFMTQYVAMTKRAARGQEIAVRLEKLPPGTKASQLKAWLKIDGSVGTPKLGDVVTDADERLNAEASIVARLDAAEVADSVIAAAKDDGVTLRRVMSGPNRVTLSADAAIKTNKDAGLWFRMTDPADTSGSRDQIIAKLKNEPQTMAVVVNWVLDPKQAAADRAQFTFNHNAFYYTGTWSAPAVSAITREPRGDKAVGTGTVSLDKLGNELSRQLDAAGIRLKDFNAVEAAFKADAEKNKAVNGPEEVTKLLGRTAKVDKILLAEVRLVGDAELKDAAAASISCRIYDVATGDYVASANWDGEASVTRDEQRTIGRAFFRDARPGEIAARKLVGEMFAQWARKSLSATFEVRNAKTLDEVNAFAAAVGSIAGVTVQQTRFDHALGSFVIVMENGKLETLKHAVTTRAAEYPGVRKGNVVEVQSGRVVWAFE